MRVSAPPAHLGRTGSGNSPMRSEWPPRMLGEEVIGMRRRVIGMKRFGLLAAALFSLRRPERGWFGTQRVRQGRWVTSWATSPPRSVWHGDPIRPEPAFVESSGSPSTRSTQCTEASRRLVRADRRQRDAHRDLQRCDISVAGRERLHLGRWRHHSSCTYAPAQSRWVSSSTTVGDPAIESSGHRIRSRRSSTDPGLVRQDV